LIQSNSIKNQKRFAWPDGRQAAVALTYDDAAPSQLDVAIPQLDAAGLKATFFLTARNMNLESLARWRAIAAEGYELGNRTIFHPCARGMFTMPSQYNDENYSVETMLNEIGVMNMFLFAIDGRSERTYASPCGQSWMPRILASSATKRFAGRQFAIFLTCNRQTGGTDKTAHPICGASSKRRSAGHRHLVIRQKVLSAISADRRRRGPRLI
jgi:hypothetical protein